MVWIVNVLYLSALYVFLSYTIVNTIFNGQWKSGHLSRYELRNPHRPWVYFWHHSVAMSTNGLMIVKRKSDVNRRMDKAIVKIKRTFCITQNIDHQELH